MLKVVATRILGECRLRVYSRYERDLKNRPKDLCLNDRCRDRCRPQMETSNPASYQGVYKGVKSSSVCVTPTG